MRRALTIVATALMVTVAANGAAHAGLFDLLRKASGNERYVAQADPPLPAPGVSTRVTPASQAAADEQPPVPVPDGVAPSEAAPAAAPPIELYPCVTYKDRHEMHPCAVPVVVAVPDPASVKHPFYWLVGDAPRDQCCDPCNPCTSCAKPMVYVQICVPPECPVPAPRVHHHDREYTYDFGAYAVDVRLHRGEIVVDYQD